MSVRSSERAGLLIVRAWAEFPDGHLLLRISSTPDVADVTLATTVASSAEDLHAVVGAWLADLRRPRDGGPGA
jgi:hypothetical protein